MYKIYILYSFLFLMRGCNDFSSREELLRISPQGLDSNRATLKTINGVKMIPVAIYVNGYSAKKDANALIKNLKLWSAVSVSSNNDTITVPLCTIGVIGSDTRFACFPKFDFNASVDRSRIDLNVKAQVEAYFARREIPKQLEQKPIPIEGVDILGIANNKVYVFDDHANTDSISVMGQKYIVFKDAQKLQKQLDSTDNFLFDNVIILYKVGTINALAQEKKLQTFEKVEVQQPQKLDVATKKLIHSPTTKTRTENTLPAIKTEIIGEVDLIKAQSQLKELNSELVFMNSSDIQISDSFEKKGLARFTPNTFVSIHSYRGNKRQIMKIKDFLDQVKLLKLKFQIQELEASLRNEEIKFTKMKVIVL